MLSTSSHAILAFLFLNFSSAIFSTTGSRIKFRKTNTVHFLQIPIKTRANFPALVISHLPSWALPKNPWHDLPYFLHAHHVPQPGAGITQFTPMVMNIFFCHFFLLSFSNPYIYIQYPWHLTNGVGTKDKIFCWNTFPRTMWEYRTYYAAKIRHGEENSWIYDIEYDPVFLANEAIIVEEWSAGAKWAGNETRGVESSQLENWYLHSKMDPR